MMSSTRLKTAKNDYSYQKGEVPHIRNVWSNNLEEEMNHISHLVDKFPFIAFDTEFPGTLVR